MKLNHSEIGRKIRDERRRLNMTQPELASAVGLSAASVSKYENGRVEDASMRQLFGFATALGVDADWLLGIVKEKEGAKRVPVLGETAAGAPLFAVEEYDDYVYVDQDDHVDFALRVKGDSMINARIFDGDLVFARRQSMVENGEIAIVVIDEGFEDCYVTTKRFYRYGSTVVLHPENPAHKDIEINVKGERRIRVVGKVIFLKAEVR